MAKKRSAIPRDVKPAQVNLEEVGDEWQSDETEKGLDLIVLSPRIKTKEEAIEKANIDLTQFQIVSVQVKSYELGMKVEGTLGKLKVTRAAAIVPLFSVAIKLKAREGWDDDTFRQMVMAEFRRAAPTKMRKIPKHDYDPEGHLAVMSIYDAHIGKLGWDNEVLKNYDVEIARTRYMECFDRLLADAWLFRPVRFLFPVGNDMLHVDTGKNQTTHGTPQDCDGRWQRSYIVAKRLILDCTYRMRELAPVDLIVIPGNHDEERMFTLGDTLVERFYNDDQVTVDNREILQKTYIHGQVFLGYEHGNNLHSGVKKTLAPQSYMNRYPQQWAACRHHEIHHGHIHTEREYVTRTASDTIGDTIFRSLPSISGSDRWHFENKYQSPLAAECHVYSKKCRRAYFTWSPEG